MDYDFRNKPGSAYDASQIPTYSQLSGNRMYGQPPPSSSSSPSSLYPKISQSGPTVVPSAGRHFPHNQTSASPTSSGLGIRATIKPEYRIAPPPTLSPQVGDIPRSNFQFDFDLERKVLAEAEKDSPDWNKFVTESHPARTMSSTSSLGPTADPIVSKYIASGLSREAVPLAVANYGDNPTKVRDFANSYTLLREMGFSANRVAEALVMYDNDTDKALAHFLNSPS